ncbi:uncharacterized protein GGS22DRAFT_175688 [Annulohypoxylon maeteangense]|uniref:uncharacterized protein n=1 Tax=Annulohypoxylon maeteangense TaxID=1927788 RepID=UPI0020074441|nr:uncharacterized protein GGS22DRAFT_175688 [Annulohypoxylon maeteangense]KAI0880166.1 hypothetical protein GGS22DRAFT_175688 [Annulohypoxylon maeteangense]
MFNQGRTSTTRGQERHSHRRRRRQVPQASPNAASLLCKIEQNTVNILALDNLERITNSHNEHGTHSRQLQDFGNPDPSSIFPHDEKGDQATYSTYFHDTRNAPYASLNQQDMDSHHHPDSGDSQLYQNQIEDHLEMSACSSLGQYVAHQELDRNFALESWRSQLVHEGPLRVIPELSGQSNFDHELGNWNNYDQISDTGATGGEISDRML